MTLWTLRLPAYENDFEIWAYRLMHAQCHALSAVIGLHDATGAYPCTLPVVVTVTADQPHSNCRDEHPDKYTAMVTSVAGGIRYAMHMY